ncbi:MAG: hypothetical protein K2J95_04795 [Lachnospiraceae bacterium]|nr:hypothetical protein [Lachnospiraceae bacterium]
MSENGYEQIGARENRLFIRPLFAGFAILIFFAGVFSLKLVDHSGFLIFSIGVVCILIGMGIITDQRNSLKKHTKNWVWVIFGVEVILASGYQLLAGSNPSLQTMNGRVQGMVSGAVIGSIGSLLLIFHFLNYYFRKKTCTQEVQAVCINLQQRWSYRSRGGSVRFIPIYEFTFRGNKLRIAGSSRKQIKVTTTGSSGREVRYYNVPKIGKQYDLMINPDDPAEFYLKKDMPCISVWVIAFVAIAIGYLLFKSTVR